MKSARMCVHRPPCGNHVVSEPVLNFLDELSRTFSYGLSLLDSYTSFREPESTINIGDYSEHTAFTPSNELDLQLMNIDSTMSPSSDVTSPMDLCFANIIDEQSNDDNDLNNITPSIKFASSLTPLESRDFPSGRQDAPSSSMSRGDGARRPTRPLVKSDKISSLSAAGIPGAGSAAGGMTAAVGSCPDSFIDRRPTSLSYPLPALSYGSPTGDGGPQTAALAVPQTTCGSVSSGNGTWTGGSNITSPSGDSATRNIALMPASMGNDTQRVAMMRARNKKDSHNRIERKRRDYINCQISELGTLLPEDMFRDGDCKKNKGSILKNSVEYICALRAENSCFVDLRREASLATGVITKLVKRIQDLESFLTPEYLAKVSSTDYQTQLQEWASTHEANQQRINTTLSSPVSRPSHVSLDTSESSPGMSSIGNEDLNYPDTKGVTSADSNSPVPHSNSRPDGVVHSTRTRCTSLCAPGQPIGIPSMLDKVDGSRAASIHPIINSPVLPFGSLPSSRRLQQAVRQPMVLAGGGGGGGGHSIGVPQPQQQASGTPPLAPYLSLPDSDPVCVGLKPEPMHDTPVSPAAAAYRQSTSYHPFSSGSHGSGALVMGSQEVSAARITQQAQAQHQQSFKAAWSQGHNQQQQQINTDASPSLGLGEELQFDGLIM
nr:unnamed protein product [Spirometra erinaceieuropaei]